MSELPQAVLVDLGGVVVRDPRPFVVAQLARRYHADPVALRTVYDRLSRSIDRGSISLREFHRRLVLAGRVPVPWSDFRRWFTYDSLVLFDSVPPALRALVSDHRVRVVFASNTSRGVWEGLVRKFALDRWADDAVLSFKVGALKPSRRFFRAAVRAGGASPGRTWLLDDSPANVQAARAMGIRAVRVRRPRDAVATLARIRRRTSEPLG